MITLIIGSVHSRSWGQVHKLLKRSHSLGVIRPQRLLSSLPAFLPPQVFGSSIAERGYHLSLSFRPQVESISFCGALVVVSRRRRETLLEH